jgi:hypothetical protein
MILEGLSDEPVKPIKPVESVTVVDGAPEQAAANVIKL